MKVREKINQYGRYCREHGIDPREHSAAQLQNCCSEGVLEYFKKLKFLAQDYEFNHQELVNLLTEQANNAKADQPYDSWARSCKIRLKCYGKGREAAK